MQARQLGYVGMLLVALLAVQSAVGQTPVGTAFTYQGQVKKAGTPLDGTADFQFSMWDAYTLGNQVGSTVAVNAVDVEKGLFTVWLDFGSSAFTGQARWLEIAVRSPAGGGAYTTLSPRQELTATPYALYALNGAGGESFWQESPVGGAIYYNGGSVGIGLDAPSSPLTVSGLIESQLDPLGVGGFKFPDGTLQTTAATGGGAGWSLTGNAGTDPNTNFLGTTDNKTLSVKVNGALAFRIEPATDPLYGLMPNIIGGHGGNTVTAGAAGATVFGATGPGYVTRVTDHYGTVGGGWGNQAGDDDTDPNTAPWATVAGGMTNIAGAVGATVGGGLGNVAGGVKSTIAGGEANHADGDTSAVGGGVLNVAGGTVSTVAGGIDNHADGGSSAVGGGSQNYATGSSATIGGGMRNDASGTYYSTVGGGYDNSATGYSAAIGGGHGNQAGGDFATVPGGGGNRAGGDFATVPGGGGNRAGGDYSLAAGRGATVRDPNDAGDPNGPGDDGTFIWADATYDPNNPYFSSTGPNQFLIRANGGVGINTNSPTSPLTVAGVVQSTTGGFKFPDGTLQTTAATAGEAGWLLTGNAGTDPNTNFLGTTDYQPLIFKVWGIPALRLEPGLLPNIIGGSAANQVLTGVAGATIAGGGGLSSSANRVTDDHGFVGGGQGNQAGNAAGTVTDAEYATVAGGYSNEATSSDATVSGGYDNIASGSGATVGGGFLNEAGGGSSTIAGGQDNHATGIGSTVGGGEENSATGNLSTVPGGYGNKAGGPFSFAAGRYAKVRDPNEAGDPNAPGDWGSFVWADANFDPYNPYFTSTGPNQFRVRATGGVAFVLDTDPNAVGALRIEPASDPNHVYGFCPNLVGGGSANSVAAGVFGATIAGGGSSIVGNRVTDDFGYVGGGLGNTASGYSSTVGGGRDNDASGSTATVGGGYTNDASGVLATVGGGASNRAIGHCSTVAGGSWNQAGGDYSFAAGQRAKVRDPNQAGDPNGPGDKGTFVWADSTVVDFVSTGANQFLVRAAGGVGVNTATPDPNSLTVNGVVRSMTGGFKFPDGTIQTAAGVTGSGTTGYLPKFIGTKVVGDSVLYESGGNVGIGYNAPNRKLYVLEDNANVAYPLKLDNPHPTFDASSVGMLFSVGGSGGGPADPDRGKGALVYTYTDTWNRGDFHFLQDAGLNKNNPELADAVMTITNTGNVGIGQTSPGYPLSFATTTGEKISFYGQGAAFTGIGLTNEFLGIHTQNSGGDVAFGYGSIADWHETMRIEGTGDVGIGTTTPVNQLDVEGCMAVGPIYSGTMAAPANGLIVQGDVGIGTTSPSSRLTVNGTIESISGGVRFPDGSIQTTAAPGTTGGGSARNPLQIALLRWYEANQAGHTLAVGASPEGVAFDGANIWVANYSSDSVTKLRASDGEVLATYAASGGPYGIAFDGANIWVTKADIDRVTKLRARDGAVLGNYIVGDDPHAVAFDGANIWVANAGSDNVTKLRASDGADLGSYTVGNYPNAVAFDGANIWVANYYSDNVTKLRASDGAVLGTYSVGVYPTAVAFDGANIWVANAIGDNVSKLRASDGQVLATYPVGNAPRGIAFDGANMWVANAGSCDVTKLRASDGQVLATCDVGVAPHGIAFDGANTWVANSFDGTVSKL